jgi:hypothetical protein
MNFCAVFAVCVPIACCIESQDCAQRHHGVQQASGFTRYQRLETCQFYVDRRCKIDLQSPQAAMPRDGHIAAAVGLNYQPT